MSEGDLPIGYEQVSIGGDCAADGSITLQVGDVKECTITNQEQPPTSLIAPTQTTCEMYRDGTAEEITELYYNTKKGIINSVTPGVIFFWSTIEAPGSEFTLMGDQFNDKGWTDMANLNVFLWDGSCNKVLTTTLSYEEGFPVLDVTDATQGATYYFSIKYDTTSISGVDVDNDYPTADYTFRTWIGEDYDHLELIYTSIDGVAVIYKKKL